MSIDSKEDEKDSGVEVFATSVAASGMDDATEVMNIITMRKGIGRGGDAPALLKRQQGGDSNASSGVSRG